MERDRIVLSIRPLYAEAIFNGRKTIEFRRNRPSVPTGTTAIVYATSPVQSIVGSFRIGAIHSGPPSSIWKQFGTKGGVSRTEFLEYFEGTDEAFAIEVHDAARCEPLALDSIRDAADFWPPQFYRRLGPDHPLSALLNPLP